MKKYKWAGTPGKHNKDIGLNPWSDQAGSIGQTPQAHTSMHPEALPPEGQSPDVKALPPWPCSQIDVRDMTTTNNNTGNTGHPTESTDLNPWRKHPVNTEQTPEAQSSMLASNMSNNHQTPATSDESFMQTCISIINAAYLSANAKMAMNKILSMPDHFLCTKPAKQFSEWFRWDRDRSKRCLQELRVAGHAFECRVRNVADTGYVRFWKFSVDSYGLPPRVFTLHTKQYAVHGYAAVEAEMKQENESKYRA